MNHFLFDPVNSTQFDANFISIYSPNHNRFQYFIQRLVGLELENEDDPYLGKRWIAYINDMRIEWDEICEKEQNIMPSDVVRFQFESIAR